MKADELKNKCTTLKKFWNFRQDKFQDWLKLILSVDTLAQEDMETTVANDPRTLFNMSRHLLMPRPMIHRISVEELEEEEVLYTTELEKHISYGWSVLDDRYRRRGYQSWFGALIDLLLITGWYSVFMLVTEKELIAEVWHPNQVYPAYGEYGLDECAHIVSLGIPEAKRMVKSKGWTYNKSITTKLNLYNYFTVDDDGDVSQGIVLGDTMVVPFDKEPAFDGVIPIACGPAGGIPAQGIELTGEDWRRSRGQSIVATNERVFRDFNKLGSFLQQAIRDTAQSRWVEKTRGSGVLTTENVFKRGGIFRITPEEDIYPLPVPIIPVEIKGSLFSMEGQQQRGGLSHMMFGSITQDISGYLMSQVAEQAQQVLSQYYETIKSVATTIDNFWLTQEHKHNLHPYGFKRPEGAPEDIRMEATYRLMIPGDIIQRATTARMLSPDIKFSQERTMDMLFPEIINPIKEIAKARAGEAMEHPLARIIELIRGLEGQAEFLAKVGDPEGARLFKQVAQALRKQIMAGTTEPGGEVTPGGGRFTPSLPPPKQAARPTPGVRPEVVPSGSPMREMV